MLKGKYSQSILSCGLSRRKMCTSNTILRQVVDISGFQCSASSDLCRHSWNLKCIRVKFIFRGKKSHKKNVFRGQNSL